MSNKLFAVVTNSLKESFLLVEAFGRTSLSFSHDQDFVEAPGNHPVAAAV